MRKIKNMGKLSRNELKRAARVLKKASRVLLSYSCIDTECIDCPLHHPAAGCLACRAHTMAEQAKIRAKEVTK